MRVTGTALLPPLSVSEYVTVYVPTAQPFRGIPVKQVAQLVEALLGQLPPAPEVRPVDTPAVG